MKNLSSRYAPFLNLCNAIFIMLVIWANHSKAETKTILAFGDSLTQGYGLPAEVGFVPQMSTWLEERGISNQMINAGVSGDTTAGGLARLEWTLFQPVDLVILNLGSNDMLRGLNPFLTYDNLNKIMEKLQNHKIPTLLIGHHAPLNYGASYKEEFEKAFAKLAIKYGVSFYPFYFKALMGPDQVSPDVQRYFQNDGLHPNAEGVSVIVSKIGPYVVRALGS